MSHFGLNRRKKKCACFLLLSAMLLSLTACGSDSDSANKMSGSNKVQDTINDQIAKENADGPEENTTEEITTEVTTEKVAEQTTEATTEKASEDQNDAKKSDSEKSSNTDDQKSDNADTASDSNAQADSSVDIDLTAMTSDMVYSTVYQMMNDPDSYVGKTVKIAGPYYATLYEDTGIYYHFIIIEDATACCQQGMEFVWGDGSHVYPDEYPELDERVEVTGTFEVYKDNPDDQYQYCRLGNATLTVPDNKN